MSKKINLLLAEDDPNFGSVLRDYLSINGFNVVLCQDGESASQVFENTPFDLCIIDVMMPLKDGLTLAMEIKQKKPGTPFIFLTAKTLKQDIMKGYQIGAEDYITKPFDSEILLHKINVVLNRNQYSNLNQASSYKIGKYTFDIPSRTIRLENVEQKISPKEAALLNLLCKHQNEVLERQLALKLIWGDSNYFSGRSMDVYVTKLRKYFKEDPSVQIENIHSSGYKLHI